MSAVDTELFRRLLQEERQRVVDAIENIHTENPGTLSEEMEEPTFPDNHLGDIATATFDREMASSLEENSTKVLTDIDAALQRIDEGTYGTCERCGRPIGVERLEALPWATLCIDDKRKQEHG